MVSSLTKRQRPKIRPFCTCAHIHKSRFRQFKAKDNTEFLGQGNKHHESRCQISSKKNSQIKLQNTKNQKHSQNSMATHAACMCSVHMHETTSTNKIDHSLCKRSQTIHYKQKPTTLWSSWNQSMQRSGVFNQITVQFIKMFKTKMNKQIGFNRQPHLHCTPSILFLPLQLLNA